MRKPLALTVKFSFIISMFISIFIVLGIQFIPYGHNHKNPPVTRELVWKSGEIRTLAKRGCFDCHSNETVWPWYSRVAPISWLVYRDVDAGRRVLNFSEWQDGRREGENATKINNEIAEGEMPPLMYRIVHPDARLTPGEKRQLTDGVTASFPLAGN
jgi:hypothetical protein